MPKSTRRKTHKLRVKKLQPPKIKRGKSLNKQTKTRVRVSRKKNKRGGIPPASPEPPDSPEPPAPRPAPRPVEPRPRPASPEPEPEPEPAPEPAPEEPAPAPAPEEPAPAPEEPAHAPVAATGPGYFTQMNIGELSPKQRKEIEQERALKCQEYEKLAEYRVLYLELEEQHLKTLEQLAMATQRVRHLEEQLVIMVSREGTLLQQLHRCRDPK